MRITYIKSDHVIPGMVLSDVVHSKNGHFLLRKGTVLNHRLIMRLKNFGIYQLPIDDKLQEEEREKVEAIMPVVIQSFNWLLVDLENEKKAVLASIQQLIEFTAINSWLHKLKTEDNHLFEHSIKVSVLSAYVGKKLKYDEQKLTTLILAALLHGIEDGRRGLDWADFAPYREAEWLREVRFITKSIAKEQAYRMPEIHLSQSHLQEAGQIIAIANQYDELLHQSRSHDKRRPIEAIEYIFGITMKYDWHIMIVFLHAIALYPVGSHVRLSNKQTGVVAAQNIGIPHRPFVRTLPTHQVGYGSESEMINLVKEPTLFIHDILNLP